MIKEIGSPTSLFCASLYLKTGIQMVEKWKMSGMAFSKKLRKESRDNLR
jgi:hypothetical protein